MKTLKFEMAGRTYTLKAMQYIYYLFKGLVHKQIAEKMGVAKGTVDHRVADIVHKAHAKNAKELIGIATREGLKDDGTYKGKKLFKKNSA